MVKVLKKKSFKSGDSTDMALLVNAMSAAKQQPWDKKKIIDALQEETELNLMAAHQVADTVEQQIRSANMNVVTTSLIRELVDAELFKRGLSKTLKQHTRIGMPVYDIEKLIFESNRENANIRHNPESINLTMAEIMLKEFAMQKVFSEFVGDAHLKGDIHIHDLGMIDRPYCSGQSLEYIKKFGLNLPGITSVSGPAKHANVLLGHMLKMTSVLQNHFAGAIGWDAVNLFFAPYLENASDDELTQLAQMMIFEFNQLAGKRDGQIAFTDINLYWEVPDHFAEVPAIGPGGEFTGRTYATYEKTAQRFVNALIDVYLAGDAQGTPFFFPKPLVHITKKFFATEGHQEFLNRLCQLAVEKGNTYFVFDRGDQAKISECCRLSFELSPDDINDAKQPWKMRFSALQNVTLNLPRVGYKAAGDVDKMYAELDRLIELATYAHKEKKNFIERTLELGKGSPLTMLLIDHDGEPYYRLRKSAYLIGLLGLNELVQTMTGEELHESMAAYRFGMRVIAHINLKAKQLAKDLKLKLVLEQTPAESTAMRMAKLDLRYYPEQAKQVIKGD
ncbi:MAG TPA: anaerobic ribonucleoside-triphosphate reductase, partial [bacterium]|nr:anaerobic ribonucleoside-triphosphate reductase [bacterium]